MSVNVLIICEGESEKSFLTILKKQGRIKLEYGNVDIRLFKSWGALKRIRNIHPGYDRYIFIHDTDDVDYVGDKIESFKNTGEILFNKPNFDFFCLEYLSLKIKNPTNEKVISKIKEKYGRGKNINYEQFLKDGSFQGIKNPNHFEILKLIDI